MTERKREKDRRYRMRGKRKSTRERKKKPLGEGPLERKETDVAHGQIIIYVRVRCLILSGYVN